MVNTVAIGNLTLPDLVEKQHLQLIDDRIFFPEWQMPLPELNLEEMKFLDRVQQDYFDQMKRGRISEGLVKLVIIAPLLHLAGFYRAPFEVRLEEPVQLELVEAGEIWRGRIDALVVQEQLWTLVIESKGASFGVDQAIPQALGYMLANPHPTLPAYGLITNGSSYGFIKLVQQPEPQYSVSEIFLLLPGRNCLYQVLPILKQIGDCLRPVSQS
jgi:hypothetical protein